jgi:hypothetical protein
MTFSRSTREIPMPARQYTFALQALRLLTRALLVSLVVSAPLLAVPAIGGVEGGIIVAPKVQKTGAGFVLLVSLQRS